MEPTLCRLGPTFGIARSPARRAAASPSQAIRIHGGLIEADTAPLPGVVPSDLNASGTISTSGTSMTTMYSCPSQTLPQATSYSVIGNTLVIITSGSTSEVDVGTFTLQ